MEKKKDHTYFLATRPSLLRQCKLTSEFPPKSKDTTMYILCLLHKYMS